MKLIHISLPALVAPLNVVLAAPHAHNVQRELHVRASACGSKGYDLGTESFDDFANTTFEACSKACLKQSKRCKSFAFGAKSECYLYSVSVADNLEADNSSPYAFYDIACTPSSSSSVSSSSTTSSTVIKPSSTTKSGISSTGTPPGAMTKTSASSSTTSGSSVTSTKATSKSSTTSSTSSIRPSDTTSTNSISTSRSSTTIPSSSPTSSSTRATASASGPPCSYPTWTITNFRFFNSSNNLDCTPGGRDVNTKYCEPYQTTQPEGYGPVDSVYAEVAGISNCYSQQPSFYPPQRPVGGGHVVCGLPAKGSNIPEPDNFHFYGSSITAKSNALFQIKNNITCSDGRYFMAYGEVYAPMECTYDAGRNATCVLNPGTVSVPATRFDSVGP